MGCAHGKFKKSARGPVRKLSKQDDPQCSVTLYVSSAKDVDERRLSKARELVNSGRPISISLTEETSTDDDDDDDNADADARAGKRQEKASLEREQDNWTGQLGLIRKFYDWEDIPLDFFVDEHVVPTSSSSNNGSPNGAGAGSKLKKKHKTRMSVQIVELTDEEARAPAAPGSLIVNHARGRSAVL